MIIEPFRRLALLFRRAPPELGDLPAALVRDVIGDAGLAADRRGRAVSVAAAGRTSRPSASFFRAQTSDLGIDWSLR